MKITTEELNGAYNEYTKNILYQRLMVAKKNIAYINVAGTFETQLIEQINKGYTNIRLHFDLTHKEMIALKDVTGAQYQEAVEEAIILWLRLNGLSCSFTRIGSSFDLTQEDGKVTYKVSYNLLDVNP